MHAVFWLECYIHFVLFGSVVFACTFLMSILIEATLMFSVGRQAVFVTF